MAASQLPLRLENVLPKHRDILNQHNTDPELCERLHETSKHPLLSIRREKLLLALEDYVHLASPSGKVALALASLRLMSADDQDIVLQHTDNYDIGKMALETERRNEAIGKGNLFLAGSAQTTGISELIQQGREERKDKASEWRDSTAKQDSGCENSM